MKFDKCNASIQIQTAYYPLLANLNDMPMFVELSLQIASYTTMLTLPFCKYNAIAIQKVCPLLRFHNRKAVSAFDDWLYARLIEGLSSGSIQRGYYFEKVGAIILPDGHSCFLRGSELLGSCSRPYLLAPEICDMRLLGQGDPPSQLLLLLLNSPPQVLLVFAYVILASVRSLLVNYGIDLQAVLYIVGGQGLGKTTLATRIAGIYEKSGKPVGIIQAGSTCAAVNTLMETLRDQPIVLDDLCLSASRNTARKRIELASKLIRQGTSSIPIIKRVGNATVELPCEAALIMTAEFYLENMSDLTRCIIVPVQKPLDIPDELTSELIGDAVRYYSSWFAAHSHEEIARFREAVTQAVAGKDMDARMATNYASLNAAFHSFLQSLRELGTPQSAESCILVRMKEAIDSALEVHQGMIAALKESFPVGNLSFCILEGYRNNAFDLAKKIENLKKHGGIIWKGDLCLRKEELIRFVHQQSGYHDWTANRITRTLKDINALVLQEENAATVRLSKNSPRVYRIRLKILKEDAQRY